MQMLKALAIGAAGKWFTDTYAGLFRNEQSGWMLAPGT
jgi:hypothetical protein